IRLNTTTLWLTVIALGLYHGINPAMGWPLAVANGMAERRASAVFATMLPLGGGHFMAIAVALAPFAWLSWYVEWHRAIRIGAGIGMAWAVYRYLGWQFVRRAWLNLDAIWGASLVLAGAAGVGLAM